MLGRDVGSGRPRLWSSARHSCFILGGVCKLFEWPSATDGWTPLWASSVAFVTISVQGVEVLFNAGRDGGRPRVYIIYHILYMTYIIYIYYIYIYIIMFCICYMDYIGYVSYSIYMAYITYVYIYICIPIMCKSPHRQTLIVFWRAAEGRHCRRWLLRSFYFLMRLLWRAAEGRLDAVALFQIAMRFGYETCVSVESLSCPIVISFRIRCLCFLLLLHGPPLAGLKF